MFTIQYKVSTNLRNPNSKIGIRKPWAKKPNTMDCKTANHTIAKNNPKFFSGALPSNPQIHVVDMVLVLTHQKLTRGS